MVFICLSVHPRFEASLQGNLCLLFCLVLPLHYLVESEMMAVLLFHSKKRQRLKKLAWGYDTNPQAAELQLRSKPLCLRPSFCCKVGVVLSEGDTCTWKEQGIVEKSSFSSSHGQCLTVPEENLPEQGSWQRWNYNQPNSLTVLGPALISVYYSGDMIFDKKLNYFKFLCLLFL